MRKIPKVFPDEKGVVQTIELEDGHKSLRPVTYVVPLELDCNDPEDDIDQERSIEEEDDDDIHQLSCLIENGSNELESVYDSDETRDGEEESAALPRVIQQRREQLLSYPAREPAIPLHSPRRVRSSEQLGGHTGRLLLSRDVKWGSG